MTQLQVDELLTYIDRSHQRTARVVRCVTPDSLEHSFGEGRFTLGDIVRHLAGFNRYMFAETAAMHVSRYSGHGRELADGFAPVVNYMETLHAETMSVLRSLPPERFHGKCTTPDGASITVWKWLRAMTEHEAHHRGQIYFCLGLLGVQTPPLFGLTPEEVRERSSAA